MTEFAVHRHLSIVGFATVFLLGACVDVDAADGERLASIEGRLASLEARLNALESSSDALDGVAASTLPAAAPSEPVAIRDLRITEMPQTFAGEIISIVEGYKLRVRDDSGAILVDAGRAGVLPPGFVPSVGQRVTITGQRDDLIDFDASLISTADGRSFPIDRRGEWE